MVSSGVARLVVVLLLAGSAMAAIVENEAGRELPIERTSARLAAAPGVRGEIEVDPRFAVHATRLGLAAHASDARGTGASPASLSADAPRATTSLARDHWTLAFEVAQLAPAEGTWEARLDLNGQDAGAIVVEAANATPASAWLVFDAGEILPRSSLYLLTLRPLQTAEADAHVIASAADVSLRWTSADGEAENPRLEGHVGVPLRITWRNDDGVVHDLVVKDAAGKQVAGPTARSDEVGHTETLAWTPTAEGEYSYLCRFHATTMRGTLAVAP